MIASIKLMVGDVELELPVDEAKKLHRELGELFVEKTVIERHYERWPQWWGGSYTVPDFSPNLIYCGNGTGDYVPDQTHIISIQGRVCATN